LVKHKIKLPKGSKDCKGSECDRDYEFDIEIPEPNPSASIIPSPYVDTSPTGGGTATMAAPQTLVYAEPPKEDKPKKLSHDEIAGMIPKGINYSRCPGEDCDHKILKNPKQTSKFKTCPGCEANTVPNKSDFCPTCKKNLEDEELEEGVVLESEEDENE